MTQTTCSVLVAYKSPEGFDFAIEDELMLWACECEAKLRLGDTGVDFQTLARELEFCFTDAGRAARFVEAIRVPDARKKLQIVRIRRTTQEDV